MSRRTAATLVAVVLLVAAIGLGSLQKGDWTIFTPGPTLNVLGRGHGGPMVSVAGRRSYRDGGALRMVTIVPTGPDQHVGLPGAIIGWLVPGSAVYPHEAIYGRTDTTRSVQQQSAVEMTSSQDSAQAAALGVIGIPYRIGVAAVERKGPAYGRLKEGDTLTAVDGRPIRSLQQGVDLIKQRRPGTRLHLTVDRAGATRQVVVRTEARGSGGAAARQSQVAVSVVPRFPFKIRLRVDPDIGGPSAGMMFALSMYDLLTPGSLTGGGSIAGTGEIATDGTVGPIGGIEQKIAGAQRDGAHLFLAPASNCDEVRVAHYDHDEIRVVRVGTLRQAVAAVTRWRQDRRAALPSCSGGTSRS